MTEPLSSLPIARSIPNLEGKVVLITGEAWELVPAAAPGARRQIDAAWRSTIIRSLARQIEGRGGRALLCQGDVTDPATAPRVVDEAVAKFGRLDAPIGYRGDPITRVGDVADYTDEYIDLLRVTCPRVLGPWIS